MALSNGIIQEVFNHLLKISTWTAPTNLYVALFTSDPGYAGGGTEVSGGSYARVQHDAASTWVKTSALDRQYENNGAITFPAATGSWGTITHFGIYDASTGGNYLAGGSLTTAKSVVSSDVLSFADADLTLDIS